jgi:hypothetical protein
MNEVKLHDPMRPLVREGNMFYMPSEDSFGFRMVAGYPAADDRSGNPRLWLDEDFYMNSPEADAFYDKVRSTTFVYEAGLEMDYESDMEKRLFTDYRAARDYVETLEERSGGYTRFIDARILTTTETT